LVEGRRKESFNARERGKKPQCQGERKKEIWQKGERESFNARKESDPKEGKIFNVTEREF